MPLGLPFPLRRFMAAAAKSGIITNVRLVGGPSPRVGLLQVQLDGGDWYKHGFCQSRDAAGDVESVVCRQLGFGAGTRWAGTPQEAEGTDYLTGLLECTGDEATLAECQLSIGSIPDCGPNITEEVAHSLVGVACQGEAGAPAAMHWGAGRSRQRGAGFKVTPGADAW